MSQKDWDDMQVRALSMIQLYLSLEVLLHVLHFDFLIKLWDRLHERNLRVFGYETLQLFPLVLRNKLYPKYV